MKTKQFFLAVIILTCSSIFVQAQSTKHVVSVSGKSSGQITIGELVGQQLIVNDGIIESFKMIVGTGENVTQIDVTGNFVNKAASNILRTQPAGTVVIFTDIIFTASDGTTKKLNDLKFTISSDK